jgi:predicted metalloprotease with PDZ domain
VEEDGIERLAEEVTGLKLRRTFDDWLRSTRELPLRTLLAEHSVEMMLRPAESSSDKGGRAAGAKIAGGLALLGAAARANGEDSVLTHVLEGGAAQESGMAAGDAIVAVDGLRPGRGGLEAALTKRRPGEQIAIHAFRRDELLEFDVRLKPAPADTCVLSELSGAKARLRDRWLAGRRG